MIPKNALITSIGIILTVWMTWIIILQPSQALSIVEQNWEVSLTMLFGSLIAGATSEGGGAIAFPIFTKLLHISAIDAKLFSLAIQSIGMTAASLVILAMRIQVEWRVILWASLGGFIGMLIGSGLLAPVLPPAVVKMSFTVMVSSFAITLFALNRDTSKRNSRLFQCRWQERRWLLIAGVVGGMMSGLVGNGIDIITFSLMVLLFKIDEKIATPTSVLLMAISATFGVFLHYFFLGGFNSEVQQYWLAAVPVVVIGAPLGAMICYLISRKLLVNILLSLIAIELFTSLLLIPLTTEVVATSIFVFSAFSLIFYWMFRNKNYKLVGS